MHNQFFKSKAIQSIIMSLLLVIFLPILAFAAPRIFYTDIVSGSNTGGENNKGSYLTIFGKGFGAIRGTSTVKIGGGEVAEYRMWSDTKVSVQLGSAVATGSIVLTGSGGAEIGPDTFTVSAGDIYFVSLTGTDNGTCGAIGTPCRTPNYVASLAAFGAGDFIIVRGGTYDLDDGTNNTASYSNRWLSAAAGESGTLGNPITFMGYPGEVVTAQIDGDYAIWKTSTSTTVAWWVVANFYANITVDSAAPIQAGGVASTCPQSGAFIEDTRIVNIDIRGGVVGGGASPFLIGRAHRVKAFGIKVHDGGIGSAVSHPIYLHAQASDVEVGWSEVYNMPSVRGVIQVHMDAFGGSCWGLDTDGNAYLNNIKIHDTTVHDVIGQAILLDGAVGNIDIYNNIIYAAPNVSSGYEDIIALRGSGGHMNARLYNNTIYANPNYTGNGWIIGKGLNGECPLSITLYNNIFYVTEAQDLYIENACAGTNIISGKNIWYGSSAGLPSFATGELTADPQFVAPLSADFHLLLSSPAIAAGIPTSFIRDFDGRSRIAGFDIGAYQYSPSIQPASPTNLIIK